MLADIDRHHAKTFSVLSDLEHFIWQRQQRETDSKFNSIVPKLGSFLLFSTQIYFFLWCFHISCFMCSSVNLIQPYLISVPFSCFFHICFLPWWFLVATEGGKTEFQTQDSKGLQLQCKKGYPNGCPTCNHFPLQGAPTRAYGKLSWRNGNCI